MKIVIVSGSNRIGRKSHQVAVWLKGVVEQSDTVDEVVLLDVAAENFPVMAERYGILENPPKGLAYFSEEMASADALIFVTPEYNGGMAGSLKNMIDYFRKEFANKPVGAVTVSSGDFAGANALHQLWFVMLHCGAIVSPAKLMVGNVNQAFDENGNLLSDVLPNRAKKFVESLIWLADKLK
ncbi:MAG: NAD(P)H-dependent oxidoreductase [Schleiferiaceae bacterium]|nr:NAD(P)H-dependent oxidoreductase [Schleiferiaceae bacterium]